MKAKIVIVGAGLAGISISRHLIKNKIPHVLIGQKPNSFPKLGESMNPEGTTELINHFSEFSDCFHLKKFTMIGVGKNFINCQFSVLGRLKFLRSVLKSISPGLKVPKDMIHIDRSKLDLAVFESIQNSPYLTYIDDRVEGIKYNQQDDVIEEITLGNGTSLLVDKIFDATNHLRLLGKATNCKYEELSSRQQVVYCHYYNDNFDKNDQCNWECSTNLLRLTEEDDDINGFAWCIPIGDYVSVGISIDLEYSSTKNFTQEVVLDLLEKSYKRRGLNYRSKFTRAGKAFSIVNQYFTHDRAYGKNWLLAGPAYNQIWYMSGSGVACSLIAAYMASKFVENSRKAGKVYQRYMDRYLKTHKTIDWFVKTETKSMKVEMFRNMTSDWLMSNINRMTRYPLIRGKIFSNIVSRITYTLMDNNFINSFHFSFQRFCPANPMIKIATMWEESSLSVKQVQKQREDVIRHLFSVISGQRPIEDFDLISQKKINLWMDQIPFYGRWFWKVWVCYLQSRTHITSLKLNAEIFEHKEGQVNIKARWTGFVSGHYQSSDDVIGTCFFENGKIRRIESKASNYTFIFGDDFIQKKVLFKIMIKILAWHFFKIKYYIPESVNK